MAQWMETGRRVVLAAFLEEMVETLQKGHEPQFDEVNTLWQLYALLRSPDSPRDTVTTLAKNLPVRLQRDILREVRELDEPGAVMLAEILKGLRPVRIA